MKKMKTAVPARMFILDGFTGSLSTHAADKAAETAPARRISCVSADTAKKEYITAYSAKRSRTFIADVFAFSLRKRASSRLFLKPPASLMRSATAFCSFVMHVFPYFFYIIVNYAEKLSFSPGVLSPC
ncbi:MAG: hypothetical protein LRY51_04210 [Geovibrio sp.]|nr:hypothetical protein [Geovibrio sp.]